MKIKYIQSLIVFLLCWHHIAGIAQETTPDTISTQNTTDLDTTIAYGAEKIENLVEDRKTYLYGKAYIKYKDMTLKAGKIVVDWDSDLVTANGIYDSVWVYNKDHSDSSKQKIITQEPVLVEGNSTMVGSQMIYDYNTEKGRVVRGRTEIEQGFYEGKQIKMVKDNTLYVSQSEFTTCDIDSAPHYHFESRRMKLIVNDRVIAKPVVMYIGKIPVAALPFAVFPTRRGRHSGVIIPRYGESAREGRYLRGLGYYWAPNDYFDARAMVDFFEKAGWMFHGGINYAVRYKMTGSISGSLTRKNFQSLYSPDYQERRWDLRVNHNQTISQTSRFTANGYFISDQSFYRDLSTSLSTRLNQELRSNATYSKSWPKHKLSLSANLSRTENLQNGDVNETLPQISFRKGQAQIFELKRKRKRGEKRPEEKWYHNFYYSYNSNFRNSRKKYSSFGENISEESIRMNHDLDLSFTNPEKIFGWLGLNHYLSYQEDWFNKTQDYYYDPQTEQIESRDNTGFAARHTFQYSAAANTKLYGVFPGFGNIQVLRHVVTPSLSFRYQPDFSDATWGYYQEIKLPNEEIVKRDRFGNTPSSGQKSLNLSVRNLFQMKYGKGEEVKKVDLFTTDLRTGFNLKATQYKLSDLQMSWRANPARNFSLSANTTHSFYQWDDEKNRRINQYIFESNNWMKGNIARLTNLNLNFSFRLRGEGDQRESRREAEWTEDTPPDELDMIDDEDLGVLEENLQRNRNRFESDEQFKSIHIPWRMNVTFNFSLSKFDPNNPIKKYYLDISGAEIQLTKNWRIGYGAHYDLEEGTISHHRFSFYRDLHCWEATVDWVPSGISKRVFFRINIKAPSLRDIKIERHGGTGSVLGY